MGIFSWIVVGALAGILFHKWHKERSVRTRRRFRSFYNPLLLQFPLKMGSDQ